MSVDIEVDGEALTIDRAVATSELVDLELDGVRHRIAVAIRGTTVDVDSSLGSTSFEAVPRFVEPGSQLAAGSLVAPMPGAVVRIEVAEGDPVAAGQLLVVLEAMKMEHPITAPAAGVVAVAAVAVGDQVDGGQLLVVGQGGRRRQGAHPSRPVRIANCSGFYGDRLSAAWKMAERADPSTSSPATTSPS